MQVPAVGFPDSPLSGQGCGHRNKPLAGPQQGKAVATLAGQVPGSGGPGDVHLGVQAATYPSEPKADPQKKEGSEVVSVMSDARRGWLLLLLSLRNGKS